MFLHYYQLACDMSKVRTFALRSFAKLGLIWNRVRSSVRDYLMYPVCGIMLILQVLMEAGAAVDAEDAEGNMPLHVKCYGETDKPSEMACIQLLIDSGADVTARNHRVRTRFQNVFLRLVGVQIIVWSPSKTKKSDVFYALILSDFKNFSLPG